VATECVVRPVYRTTCDRCAQPMPEQYEQRAEWLQLDIRQAGAPSRPQADLCQGCGAEFARFMEGKATDAASH
jgi:hypothetical protein